MWDVSDADPCPCGSGRAFPDCCGPLLTTDRLAETAEELMRSRFTAYYYGNAEHLWRTWHPRTRPREVTLDQGVQWVELRVNEARDGGSEDDAGIVDFTATYDGGALHEVARFERRAGRWFYVEEAPS